MAYKSYILPQIGAGTSVERGGLLKSVLAELEETVALYSKGEASNEGID